MSSQNEGQHDVSCKHFFCPGREMDDGPARTEQVDHALIDRLGEYEQILDDHPTSQVAARVFQVIVEELKMK
jgi:hypothetical protein